MTTTKPAALLLTFSGAHATGKSTLAGDVCARLNHDHARSAMFVPSFTGRLFERMRKGNHVTPTSTLPGKVKKPRSYEEIDAFGLREWYQLQLPGACAFEVEAVVFEILGRPGRTRPLYFIILDRWFPDILAYTAAERPEDGQLYRDVAAKCREAYGSLTATLQEKFQPVSLMNVFVPLSASLFSTEGQDEKFRATCDRDTLQRECLDGWAETLGLTAPHLTISKSDRSLRVAQVMRAIDETQLVHRA